MENKFSVSQLISYARCPNQYYFKHIAKVQAPTSAQTLFGTSLTRAIKHSYFFKKDQKEGELPIEEAKAMFVHSFNNPTAWDDTTALEIDYKGKDPVQMENEGIRLLEIYLGSDQFQQTNPLSFEKKFSFCLDLIEGKPFDIKKLPELEKGVEISSHFDILTKDGILDIKQSRAKWSQFDVDSNLFYRISSLSWFLNQADILQDETETVQEYSWPMLPKTCNHTVDVIVKLKEKPYVQRLEMTSSAIMAINTVTLIMKLIRGIENYIFFPSIGVNCENHCPYRDLCQGKSDIEIIG